MIATKSPLLLVFLTLTVQFTNGCGGSTSNSRADKKTQEALNGAPQWVRGDCRSFFEGQPVLCGVGGVSGIASPSLARSTAMARGRTEIARYLSTEVKSIITDYEGMRGGASEQEIEARSTQISDMTLSGTQMESYYQAPDGQYFALMALELESFKQSIESSTGIEDELKRALIDNATKAFSVRDSEVSRY